MSYKLEMIITNNNLPLLQQLEPLMRARLLLALEQIGLLLEKGAVLAIQNQVAPDGTSWEALQEWYVEWKRQKGFSEQIYLMSSSYLQAITHKVDEESFTTIAGVMKDSGPVAAKPKAQGELFNSSQEDIWQVAQILEYGWEEFNVKIPPRPLWRPLLEVNKRPIQTRVGAAIYWATEAIQKQAGGVA